MTDLTTLTSDLEYGVQELREQINQIGKAGLTSEHLVGIGKRITNVEDALKHLSNFKSQFCVRAEDIEEWRKP